MEQPKNNNDDLIASLNKLTSTIKEITDITERTQNNGRSYLQNEVYKKVEDGILDNFYTAKKEQQDVILNRHRFVYYSEFNNDRELLLNEIKKRNRNKVIQEILK